MPLHCILWKESIGQTWSEYPGGSYCTVFRRCECILRTCVADIQEFYELTLLDDTKSIQQKTAETIRIANKWEASDGPITPTYSNNDVSYITYQHAKGSEISPQKEASAEFLRSVSRISCQYAQHRKSFPKNIAIQALMHGVPNAFFACIVLGSLKGWLRELVNMPQTLFMPFRCVTLFFETRC